MTATAANNTAEIDATEEERLLREDTIPSVPGPTINQQMEHLTLAEVAVSRENAAAHSPTASSASPSSSYGPKSRWSREKQRRREYFAARDRRVQKENDDRVAAASLQQLIMTNAICAAKLCGITPPGWDTFTGQQQRDRRGMTDRRGRGRRGRGRGGNRPY